MAEWLDIPPLRLSICFLFSGLILQTMAAAWIARRFFTETSRPAALGFFALALTLMLPLHWRPLELALGAGVYDSTQAALSFCVALLLFLAVAAGFPPRESSREKPRERQQETPKNRP
jgi:hypothetical protein